MTTTSPSQAAAAGQTKANDSGLPNSDTPIIVLSASARNEDHEAGMLAGADAYLNKPIDFGALAELMARAAGGRESLREGEHAACSAAA